MVKLPSAHDDAFICNVLPAGAIELALVRDGIEFKSQPVTLAAAAIVAATALKSAKECHNRSGALLEHGPHVPRPQPIILAFSSIGLGPGSNNKGAALLSDLGMPSLALICPMTVSSLWVRL